MADFLIRSAARYALNPGKLIAVGYSNGANIAAAVLQVRPEIFSSVILLRPMLPLPKLPMPDLGGKPVLILRGNHDSIIPADSTDRLIHLLEQTGADVQTHMLDTGHRITQEDIDIATRWLAEGETAGSRPIAAAI